MKTGRRRWGSAVGWIKKDGADWDVGQGCDVLLLCFSMGGTALPFFPSEEAQKHKPHRKTERNCVCG